MSSGSGQGEGEERQQQRMNGDDDDDDDADDEMAAKMRCVIGVMRRVPPTCCASLNAKKPFPRPHIQQVPRRLRSRLHAQAHFRVCLVRRRLACLCRFGGSIEFPFGPNTCDLCCSQTTTNKPHRGSGFASPFVSSKQSTIEQVLQALRLVSSPCLYWWMSVLRVRNPKHARAGSSSI